MGILDEAIREHLELKRVHGATQDELARLEKEAFGPPTRPGEPDFPDSEDAAAAAETAGEQPAEPIVEGSAEPPIVDEVPTGVTVDETVAPPPIPLDAAPEPEVVEEHAILEDEEPPPEPVPELVDEALDEDVAADEPEDAGEETAAFYDQEVEPELDLADLDLALEPEDAEEPEAVIGEETGSEAPVETVEYSVEEELTPPGPPLPEEPGEDAAEEHGPEEAESDAEDVLEETPEFLRDQPEDDQLWFEQGEPKDFDFD
jgi:hypothetical protein